MRVRGLKFIGYTCKYFLNESHPMRVRGLKSKNIRARLQFLRVAPHAGAWIEMAGR